MSYTIPQLLEGRKAVVTGAAHGIGLAIANGFAMAGATVLIADIDEPAAEAAARSIVAAGGSAIAALFDAAADASSASLAATAEARMGGCDILVNNAGIYRGGSVDSVTIDDFQSLLDVNLTGYLRTTQVLLPLLRAAGGEARIVNMASIMGVRAGADSIAYSVAKAGIVNLTRALASDLGPEDILVNAIGPGFIDTRMAVLPDEAGHEHETDWFQDIYIKYGRIPLRRPGVPDDVVGPALFLASSQCRYVTGQMLLVDGGLSSTF